MNMEKETVTDRELFQSSSKTRSTLYKFIWFLHLLTKTSRSIAKTDLTYPPFWLNCFWGSIQELTSFEWRSKTLQSATSVLVFALNFTHLAASSFTTYSRSRTRENKWKISPFFLWFNFWTKFPQNKAKCMYSHDLNFHREICAYSRFCETKELKGENNSVLHSLFSLPPTTYWWASSCILGNQWLKRFHRVTAWLRVIW